jgi:hypothetical protein
VNTIISTAVNGAGAAGTVIQPVPAVVLKNSLYGPNGELVGELTRPKITSMVLGVESGDDVAVQVENASEGGDAFALIHVGSGEVNSCTIHSRTATGFTATIPSGAPVGSHTARYTRQDGETALFGYTLANKVPRVLSVQDTGGFPVVQTVAGTIIRVIVDGEYDGEGDSLQLVPTTGSAISVPFDKEDGVLTATIPDGTPLSVYALTYTDKNDVSDTYGFEVSAASAPEIIGLSVDEGSTSGGTLLVIYVRNFGAIKGQVFLDEQELSVLKYTDSEVSVRTGAHEAGGVGLRCVTGGGDTVTLQNAFTFVDYSQGALNSPRRMYVPHVLLRKEPGQYVEARWADGEERQYTLYGLPLQQINPFERQVLPENLRSTEGYVLYTDVLLSPVDLTNRTSGDRLLVGGEAFVVLTCYKKQGGVLNHYKVILVRDE